MQTSITGGVLVDHLVPGCSGYQVVIEASTALSAYLMWSDIKDNHNKYYIAQGLQKGNSYFLWTRYGRVGLDGVGSTEGCASLDHLKKLYQKKYNEKTRKGYTEVKMKLGQPNSSVEGEFKKIDTAPQIPTDLPKSKLEPEVQSLISFIFDDNLIQQSVVKIGYDVKRLPLG